MRSAGGWSRTGVPSADLRSEIAAGRNEICPKKARAKIVWPFFLRHLSQVRIAGVDERLRQTLALPRLDRSSMLTARAVVLSACAAGRTRFLFWR
jgi:hypothetical protein